MLDRWQAKRFARELGAFVRDRADVDRINLLAPDRSVFRFDCDALDRFAPELNIIRISSARQLPSMRLGQHEGLAQRDFFASDGEERDPFQRSQSHLEDALSTCVSEGLLQGFLSANVDYHQDEPLRRAARRLGLPFFVVLKETPLSAEHARWQRAAIGERPVPDRGDHVFVGGPLGGLYVELGCVAPERLYVTGFPRFDQYGDASTSGPLDRIMFFPPNRLHSHSTEVFDDLLDAALELRRRTETTLVLKCKDNRAAREVRDALGERTAHEGVIVTTANPAEHLLRSALVVGASTTALAEALMTRANVVNLISRGDLLGIPAAPELGYRTYAEHRGLVADLGAITDLRGLPVPATSIAARRALVAAVLEIPTGRLISERLRDEIRGICDREERAQG